MLKTLLVIGLGSFCGGIFRFLLSRWVQGMVFFSFPLGTFVVNMTGCFLIGLFYGLFDRSNCWNPELRLFLTVGLCGGFTTFSTFINENFLLLREQQWFSFAMYTGLSVVVGLSVVYLGYWLVKAL